MNRDEVIAAAKEQVLEQKTPFLLATATEDAQPFVRWMGGLGFHEPFTVYLLTHRESRKLQHVAENPTATLLLNRPDFSRQVLIYGRAAVEDSTEVRHDLWAKMPQARKYFSGPDDPGMAIIGITPGRLEVWTGMDQMKPEIVEL